MFQKTVNVGKDQVICTYSDGAFGLWTARIFNDNQVITCSGYPTAVSGKVYKYKFKFIDGVVFNCDSVFWLNKTLCSSNSRLKKYAGKFFSSAPHF